MAVVQFVSYPDSSSLANFIAWAQPISNALASFGWVKTGDSGQVNWGTLVSVPASGGYVYEIWQMGDALQATLPVFVKFEYGNFNNQSLPSLAVTVGTGSNGSGTITNAGTRCQLSPNGGDSANQYECNMSGSTNRFHCFFWRGYQYGMFFSVERSHDVNGNDTSAYITYLVNGAVSQSRYCAQQSIMPAPGGPGPFEVYGLTVQTSSTNTPKINGSVAVAPFWPMVAGKLGERLLGALCLKSADLPDGEAFTATISGTARTYMVMKTQVSNANNPWGNQTTNCIAMRLE